MVAFDQWYGALNNARETYESVAHGTFGADQYFGQQGFSTRDDVLALAAATLQGSSATARLLDLCCGPGAAADLVQRELGACVTGLDLSVEGLRVARAPFRDLSNAMLAADALALPFRSATFDAMLLLDSIASIAHPPQLFGEISRVLVPRGRFAFTAESGEALRGYERAQFTHSSAPTLISQKDLPELLRNAGCQSVAVRNTTCSAGRVAQRLVDGLCAEHVALERELGRSPVEDLIATLTTLAQMLASGRIQEIAVVAERIYD